MLRHNINRTRLQQGFTLTELMMVVVIVAVLMAIALPAFQGNASKARRADGQAALVGLSMAMEQLYTEKSPSTYVGASVGTDAADIYPAFAPLTGNTKFYQLSITNLSATTYTLNAAPINGQAEDECGTLTLTQLGVKGVSGADTGITWDDCWR